jgi:hypothetical protein
MGKNSSIPPGTLMAAVEVGFSPMTLSLTFQAHGLIYKARMGFQGHESHVVAAEFVHLLLDSWRVLADGISCGLARLSFSAPTLSPPSQVPEPTVKVPLRFLCRESQCICERSHPFAPLSQRDSWGSLTRTLKKPRWPRTTS